jgi:transcription elongation factor Elf1
MIVHVKLKCKKIIFQSIQEFYSICSSDRKANVGTIECRMCQETYSTAIHCKILFFLFSSNLFFSFIDLSEAVDVYNSWIDACEEQNRD